MPRRVEPPTISDPKDQLEAARLLGSGDAAVAAFLQRVNDDEYLHWEDARFKPNRPVADAVCWALIKLARQPRILLPLLDASGRAFSITQPAGLLRAQHRVDRSSGARVAAEGDEAIVRSSRKTVIIGSLMDEAIASSQIEGAVTTRVAAKAMLRAGRSARNRSEQMIVNGYRTMSMLRERAREPLGMDLLLDIQRSITQGTLDDEADAGRLRTSDDIRVVEFETGDVVHAPPPARELRKRLNRMFAFANCATSSAPWLHPLVRASILHFWLAYEHPFVDGNGRTARALLYWSMLRDGYELFEFLTISQSIHAAREQYYRAFRHSESDDNDLTYFVAFQAHMVLRAVDELWQRLDSIQRRQRRLLTLARTAAALNPRQRLLLEHAIRHPTQIYTFEAHRNSHGVSYATARGDVLDLAKRGFLVRLRSGKEHAFRPAEGLEGILARRK